MKRLFSFLLTAVLIFICCSCKSPKAALSTSANDDEDIKISSVQQTSENADITTSSEKAQPTSSNKPTQNTNPSSSQKNNSSKKAQVLSYEDIVCDETAFYQTIRITVKNSNTLLSLDLPHTWTFKSNGDNCHIYDGNKKIGQISCKDGAPKSSTNEESTDITYSDIDISHNINRLDSPANSFIRIFTFTYKNTSGNFENVILTVNYEEVDSEAVVTMFENMQTAHISSENISGTLKIENSSNKILILGNSFIGSSSIGNILQKMCADNLTVEAFSRGYADVFTYTNDSYIMGKITSGEYGAVFMCGFYSILCADEFQKIVSACEMSNTKVAIFPAHNEGESNIRSAKTQNPYAVLVDWKSEIDSFIDSGHDQSKFCINDSHKHSTPLAGYIGAHMIYRAVFDKMPPQVEFDEVSSFEINELGDYAESGHIFNLENAITIKN